VLRNFSRCARLHMALSRRATSTIVSNEAINESSGSGRLIIRDIVCKQTVVTLK
jgi:hypothetical protein